MVLIKIDKDGWWVCQEYMKENPKNRVSAMIISGYLKPTFKVKNGMELYQDIGSFSSYKEGVRIHQEWRNEDNT